MKKQNQFDVIVIGGGLAGLTCALHLSIIGSKVLLLEKQAYPRHKVCGEYVSNEVLPYLKSLGFDPFEFGAKQITELEITTRSNKKVNSKLPLGGFGISRFCFDHQLALKAQDKGAKIIYETVQDVQLDKSTYTVTTKEGNTYESEWVIGSYGKRSFLDKRFNRSFIQQKSPYLGVKIHVKGRFPENKVALHNFKGGYCGVSKVENDFINLCYITNFASFKKYKNIHDFQEQVVFKNKALFEIFHNSEPVFKEPLTISQISFESKPLIENDIFMCGDAAAMIHPLCGNGMGMAISSAKLLCELLEKYFKKEIKSRKQLEIMYISHWNKRFKRRLWAGHQIAAIFKNDFAAHLLWNFVRAFPFLMKSIIKKTHGQELQPL